MPYGRKRYHRRRGKKYLSKSYIKSKTGRKSQANQIVRLQRQIKTINSKVNDTTQYVQYLQQLTDGDAPITLTSGVMTCLPLVEPDKWERLFQSDGRTDNSNKFRGRSLGMQAQFILGNTEEPSPPLPVFMYVVSLRKERGQEFLNDLGTWTSAEKSTGKVWPTSQFINKY